MSDYHVLDGDTDGNSFRVAMHIPIPVGNNRAGVAYRTALISALGGSQVSVVPGLAGAEQTQLTAGELYEHVELVATNPGETATAYRDRLDAIFTARKASILAAMQRRLDYYGFSRNVP